MEWNKCIDALPENFDEVIFSDVYGDVHFGVFYAEKHDDDTRKTLVNSFWKFTDSREMPLQNCVNVNFWMKKPQPPKDNP